MANPASDAVARDDRFLLIADAILGPHPAAIQYQVRFPLADDIHFDPEGETREGVLGNHRAISAVLPLSLPEWRAAPTHGTLQADGDAVQLAVAETTPRLYVPVLFDLALRRRGGAHLAATDGGRTPDAPAARCRGGVPRPIARNAVADLPVAGTSQ